MAGGLQGQAVVTVFVAVAVEGAIRWRFGISAALPAFAYLGVVGSGLAVNDAFTLRIPNWVALPSYPIAAALLAVASGFEAHGWSDLAHGGIGAVAVLVFYLGLALAFPHQLGLGDVWLGGLLGLYLGWLGGQEVVAGTLAGWLLAVAGVGYHRLRHADPHDEMALGPYLCLGALLVILR